MKKSVKNKLIKYGKILLKLSITAAALYIVFREIDITQVLTLYKKSNLLLLIAGLIAFTLSQWVSAYRLNNYLRCLDVNISENSNFKLFLLGMYYNLFLPGGIGGDGYKIYLLNKKFKAKVKQLFWAVFLDRINGMVALVCMGFLLAIFVAHFGIYRWFILILLPTAIIVHYFLIKWFWKQFSKVVPITITQSFIKEIFQLLCALFILLAFGTTNHLIEYMVLFLVSSIVATIPITIGGVGAREITFLYGAEFMHLDINQSIALSFMFYLMTVLVSFSGIYYSFKPAKLAIENHEQNN